MVEARQKLWSVLGLPTNSSLPRLPPTCSHLSKPLFLSPSSLLLKSSPLLSLETQGNVSPAW